MSRCPAPLHSTAIAGGQSVQAGNPRMDLKSTRPSRPLRVLQVTDGKSRPGAVGKLLMSGRMADVCAELERLSALEDRKALH